MGQKTSPIGFRLGIVKPWRSRWFNHKNMPEWLAEDKMIRNYLKNRLSHAAISRVEIERTPKRITVMIFTARPGVVIGRKGSEVDKLRDELARLLPTRWSIASRDNDWLGLTGHDQRKLELPDGALRCVVFCWWR